MPIVYLGIHCEILRPIDIIRRISNKTDANVVKCNSARYERVANWLRRKSVVATLSLSFALFQFTQLPTLAGSPPATTKKKQQEDVKVAASQLNDFSLRALKELLQTQNKNENVVIAPLGIAACTSVLATGAKGKTQDELLKVLSLKKTFSSAECSKVYKHITRRIPDVDVTFASSIYAPNSVAFDSAFKERFRTQFDGATQTASSPDKLSAQVIEWVKEKSKNTITLNSLDINTSNVGIINVLYFKALWNDQFDPTGTTPENFFQNDGSKMSVDMMHKFFEDSVGYAELADSQTIRLPYRSVNRRTQSPFSMYVILPKKGQKPEKILSEMTATNFTARVKTMQYKMGSLSFPRFAVTVDSSFTEALQELGAREVFTPKADLSGMDKNKSAYLDQITQKLKLIVNERGTEASAFTHAEVVLGGDGQKPFEMVVNRPFIIVVRDDESGAILFIGLIRNPEKDLSSAQTIEREFSKKINDLRSVYSKAPTEECLRELEDTLSQTRDYFFAKRDFKSAKDYSSQFIALAKLPTSNSAFTLADSLTKHIDIELKLGDKASALSTIKELIEVYFHWNSDPTRDPRIVDEWREWERLLEDCDKHLIDLHQDRARVLDARELILKVSIRDSAKNKEWHYGAWRRKPTTIGIPDNKNKIDFKQFMNYYQNSLKVLEKDTAKIRSLQKNRKAFLQWSPTFRSNGYDDLGQQQLKLARVYLDKKKPEKAVQFLELSILNFFEDKDSDSVVPTVETLIKTLKLTKHTSEADELSGTFNYCKNTCNTYLSLHKKWEKLQEEDSVAYQKERIRQEREDWERESKHAK